MKAKKLIAFLVSACAVLCCILGVSKLTDTANAIAANSVEKQTLQEKITLEEFLEEVYKVGDTVVLPVLDGKDCIIYDPDGNGYLNDTIALTIAGKWQLVVSDANSIEEYEFTVYPSLSTSSGSKSKVAVGKMGDYSKYDAQGRGGIYTEVAINETVTFNEVIDLNEATKENTILEFSVFPSAFRIEDASILVLTFSDVEDPSNKFDVWLRAEPANYVGSWQERCIYIRSGATGQRGSALEKSTTGPYTIDGEQYVYHNGDFTSTFGIHTVFSLRGVGAGMEDGENIGQQVFGLSFDNEEKRLYTYEWNNGRTDVGPHLINDFDNKDIQGETVWSGFKSGKCKLTISARNYKSTAFTMLITKLGNQTTFEKDYIENDKPAEISIIDADMSRVTSLVQGMEFPIPKAIAYDAFGNALNVSTNVYTGYKTGSQANIDIKSGSFTPTQLRDYTLVYSCVDQWGNLTEKVYNLPARSKTEYNKFNVKVNASGESVKIGEEITIQEPIVADNYVGRYAIEVSARLGAETIQLGKFENNKDFEPISFVPKKAGNWIIVYKYSDMIMNDTVFYTVDVQSGGQSYFDYEAPVPKYIILNAKCDVPAFYGYDFSGNEGVWTKAKTYITTTKDYTGAQECTDASLTWTQDVDFVYYTYVLNGAVKQYEIPVVDVKYKTENQDALAYFYGYEGEPVPDNEGVTYKVAQRGGRYLLGFANQIQAYNFRSDLKVPQDAGYSKVSIYLTDVANASNVLKLSYTIGDNDKVYYSVNDGTQKALADINRTASLSFEYQAKSKSLTFITATEKVLTNLSGEKWAGFETNFVWMEIELEEVVGTNTSVNIGGVNNQRFYEADSFETIDMAPEYYQDADNIAAKNQLGTKVILPSLCVADVFAVGIDVVLTATAPDGTILKDINGVTLKGVSGFETYEVELAWYGFYEFKYVVTDDLGRVNRRGVIQVEVTDMEAPNVVINEYASIVAINSKLAIASLTISDNVSNADNCTYSVYIQLPNYAVVALSQYDESNPFVFAMTGKYTIVYMVVDEAQNATYVSYNVYVK